VEGVGWCGGGLLDGRAGSAVEVLVAVHYSVLDARDGCIGDVVVWGWLVEGGRVIHLRRLPEPGG